MLEAMSDLTIEPATPADAETIHELILALARYERLEGEVTATVADTRELLFGSRPFAEALLARRDGEPIGFAVYFHNVSTFAGRPGLYLEDLFVKPEHRHGGVGTALLQHLAGVARARGCARMEWMALDWNRPALEFYRKMGAQIRAGWVTLRLDGPALEKVAGP